MRFFLSGLLLLGISVPVHSNAVQANNTSIILKTAQSAAPSSWDCAAVLEMLAHLAGLSDGMPGIRAIPQDSSFKALADSDWSPEWVKQLVGINAKFKPQFDFIRFADSELLLQVTAVELRALGYKTAKKATGFLHDFTSISSDRQLAFVNAIVFRLLWETQNNLARETNQKRLALDPSAFEESLLFLTLLQETELPNLALFLSCHFGFRSDAFGARLTQAWEVSSHYANPFPKQYDQWLKSHGMFLNPENGQRLYTSQELITLLSSLAGIRADRAIDFFLDIEGHHFSITELRSMSEVSGLKPESQSKIYRWLAQHTGEQAPDASEVSRLRQLRAAESELAVVDTRLRLMGWVDNLGPIAQPLGQDPAAVLAQFQGQIGSYLTTVEQDSYEWVYSGVRLLLAWAGYSDSAFSTAFVSTLLSQTLRSTVAQPAIENLQLLIDNMSQQIGPIMAFARELQSSPNTPGDTTSLARRRDELQRRIENLRNPRLPAPHG